MIVDLLFRVPSWLLAILIILAVTAYAVAGQLLVRRWVSAPSRRSHNDLTGPASALIGIVFAVLIAFIAVVVWQQYDTTERTVVSEANVVGNLWHQALGYPEPLRIRLRQDLRDYVDAVINEEWTLQQRGETSPHAWRLLEATHREILRYEPKTEGGGYVWTVMLLGTALMIGTMWLFGEESLGIHLATTIGLAVSIGLVFYLIVTLDYPFRGDLRLKPAAFEQIRGHIDRLAADERAAMPQEVLENIKRQSGPKR